MLILDDLILHIEGDIPSIEYGRGLRAEWLSFDTFSLTISGQSKVIVGQMIEDLWKIYINLEEEAVE